MDALAQASSTSSMSPSMQIERWFARFPLLTALPAPELTALAQSVCFRRLDAGDVAYEQDATCPNYLMCIEGLTRVFKISEAGREMLIYKVEGGGTCVLTTQCLLTGARFPAQSTAESPTELAAIPAPLFHGFMAGSPAFRALVMSDYTRLLSGLFSLIDEVAFAPLHQRLARRLLAEADEQGRVAKTHQQLADDVGSVREMVTRRLGEWERAGWVRTSRGRIEVRDAAALAAGRDPVAVAPVA
jgi:CRP/FNR family transcriptional regulator, anaerobic regulatory protein